MYAWMYIRSSSTTTQTLNLKDRTTIKNFTETATSALYRPVRDGARTTAIKILDSVSILSVVKILFSFVSS